MSDAVKNTLIVLLVISHLAFYSGTKSAVDGKIIEEAVKSCGSIKAIGELYPSKIRFSDDWEYVRCLKSEKRQPFVKIRESSKFEGVNNNH